MKYAEEENSGPHEGEGASTPVRTRGRLLSGLLKKVMTDLKLVNYFTIVSFTS